MFKIIKYIDLFRSKSFNNISGLKIIQSQGDITKMLKLVPMVLVEPPALMRSLGFRGFLRGTAASSRLLRIEGILRTQNYLGTTPTRSTSTEMVGQRDIPPSPENGFQNGSSVKQVLHDNDLLLFKGRCPKCEALQRQC